MIVVIDKSLVYLAKAPLCRAGIYTNSFLIPSKQERNDTSRAAFEAAYERLQKSGVKSLHYLEGENLLGADGEDTVDSSHPTDLGFMRQAEAFEKVLGPLLGR